MTMRIVPSALATLAIAAAVQLTSTPAEACGGCFHGPQLPNEEGTQVTGHRMIMAIGKEQSTLYDQIEYVGDPSDFAWVLPIRGQVTVGLSSDVVFNALGQRTSVVVQPPPNPCPQYDTCNTPDFGIGSSATGTGGGTAGEGGVTVNVEEVVGPYETVQLSSTDPTALTNWLDQNGYEIPTEIEPIIAAYVDDGFDFLALRLSPGEGVDKMQPVRVTSMGASVNLPLRMVAAGTGATTTVTLWVLSEGRYEAQNFPNFTISADDLVWDWSLGRSNFNDLRQAQYESSNGTAWLTESSTQMSDVSFRSEIFELVDFFSEAEHGYYATPEMTSRELAEADMDALFTGIDLADLQVTRMRAELSRPALAQDLVLAGTNAGEVPRLLQAAQGTALTCPPPPPPCDTEGVGTGGNGASAEDNGGSCAIAHEDADASWVLLAGLGLVLGRRRRRR